MKQIKHLPRRTFLQERFEILISRQKRGLATFAELTELDDLVNRNAMIRDQVLDEMQKADLLDDDPYIDEVKASDKKSFDLIGFIKSWFTRFYLKNVITQKRYNLLF